MRVGSTYPEAMWGKIGTFVSHGWQEGSSTGRSVISGCTLSSCPRTLTQWMVLPSTLGWAGCLPHVGLLVLLWFLLWFVDRVSPHLCSVSSRPLNVDGTRNTWQDFVTLGPFWSGTCVTTGKVGLRKRYVPLSVTAFSVGVVDSSTLTPFFWTILGGDRWYRYYSWGSLSRL